MHTKPYLEKNLLLSHLTTISPVPRVVKTIGDSHLFFAALIKDQTVIVDLIFRNTLDNFFAFPTDKNLPSFQHISAIKIPPSLYEVIQSDWLNNLENPHNLKAPAHSHHYIFVFQEAVFECIAQSISFNFFENSTVDNAVKNVIK